MAGLLLQVAGASAALIAIVVVAYLVAKGSEHRLGDATGLVVPLFNGYTDSGDWETVISMKQSHPEVPMIAIINPSSGSGNAKNDAIGIGIARLKSAGIDVVGYVSTRYSLRNYSEVAREIENYYMWYGVDGIFFDEVSHWPGNEEYYINAVSLVRSFDSGCVTIGNPGTDDAMQSYMKVFDILVIYESYGTPSLSKLESYGKSRENLAVFSFGIDSLDERELGAITENVGWIFMTQGVMPNPWNELPTYFGSLVEMID